MHVLIVSPYRTVVPHFETELDLAQQHLDAGDTVEFQYCGGGLSNCEFNPQRDPAICQDCLGRRQMGLEMLEGDVQIVELAGREPPPELPQEFASVEQLTAFHWRGFDLGYAALSSLVSQIRDPEPDLHLHRDQLTRLIVTAWQAYEQTRSRLESGGVDRVYVYNGRFAGMRGVLRACQQLGVDCYLHERGCDGAHYELLQNHLPHDLDAIEQAIRRVWDRGNDDPQREAVARSWYHERRDRVEKVWHSFTKDQQPGRLPDRWDPTARNISIFCSSDDEFVAIGDAWHNALYPNQVDAIEQLVADLGRLQPETRVTLRMHPNLRGLHNRRCQRMRQMAAANLTVVLPEAEVDTYALVEQSDVVVSFGSSVGIEAVYWGTPSVLLGPCFYQHLGGVYRPPSHSETLRLLGEDLSPQPIEGALQYGYWFQRRGLPHVYFQSRGLFEGTFKGEVLYARQARPPRWRRWQRKLAKLISGPAT